jgi:hypothetical protein
VDLGDLVDPVDSAEAVGAAEAAGAAVGVAVGDARSSGTSARSVTRQQRAVDEVGHSLHTTATWLAVVLALAVAPPPVLAIVVPWLIRPMRFFWRKRLVPALAATSGGTQLIALRALANRPLRRPASTTTQ